MKLPLRICIIALVTGVLLFPYLSHISSESPGIIGIPHPEPLLEGDSDVFEESWHFWWVSNALARGLDPRHCEIIYPPEGASLAYQHIGWTDTFLFALAGTSGSPALPYDLSLLLGTLLTALFGWFLARSWGISRIGALFAALALAWLPSRTAHLLQHYQIANCWTLIASMWLCRSYLTVGGRLRLVGFAVVSVAAAMQSPFLLIFAAAAIPASVFIGEGSWKKSAILGAALAPAAAALFLVTFTAPGDAGALSMGWREAVYWSAEPQSFLLPSPFGPLGRLFGMPAKVSWMPNVSEGVVGPGLVITGLLVWLAIRKGGWKFAVVIGALFILGLGPELRVLGRPLGIPLPFRLLQILPILEGIRAPSRFALLGGILAVIGAGVALSGMRKRTALILLGLMTAELLVPVLPAVPSRIPAACRELPEGTVVLEIPVETGARRYSLFQTATGYTRSYSFLARPGGSEHSEGISEAMENADVVLYHRWLMDPSERMLFDSIYSPLFPDAGADDSVWTAHSPADRTRR